MFRLHPPLFIVHVPVFLHQLGDISAENAMLKGKIASLKDYLQSAELETKASRETIMRLVSESEREQRTATKFTLEVDNLRVVGTQC